LQKPTDGVQRPSPERRRPHRASLVARINQRSVRLARSSQAWLSDRAGTSVGSLASATRAALRSLATPERALPVGVAGLVAVASLLAVLPGTPMGAVGGVTGTGQPARIAIGGGFASASQGPIQPIDGAANFVDDGRTFTPVVIPEVVTTAPGAEAASADPGNFLDDGTLLTGYAPNTDVADGADLIGRYKVKSGDTLGAIADKFGVSMMTLWWANKLDSKDDLHVGQVLRIPPVSGLVVTVTDSDTLDSLATRYDVKASRIVDLNGLDDTTLVVGQVLVIPGAKGAPIPTPKPTPKPAPKSQHSGGSSGGGGSSQPRGQVHYTGGRLAWPVVGGHNYISQYAHAGHMALDIAADYGAPVVAAAGGRVVFAGWKNNGGGWQVWINHGGGMYTTYNHMSGLSVGNGQSVGRGQRVGRIGASGWATGPHLHFEVWLGGVPWSGGYQTNPLRYY
jgi:murein DD-endopeptidase MepM/ murein hydrolase activator NlpD